MAFFFQLEWTRRNASGFNQKTPCDVVNDGRAQFLKEKIPHSKTQAFTILFLVSDSHKKATLPPFLARTFCLRTTMMM